MVAACHHLFVALALVSAMLLGLAVSIVALLCNRAREAQPVRLKVERRAAR